MEDALCLCGLLTMLCVLASELCVLMTVSVD
jgi:hypothetical protein